MKLRNKKTGEIGNFCYGYTNELCVSWQKDDGFWGKQEYDSLAELNEEWCDYEEPKEYWFIDEFGLVQKEIEYYYEENKEAVHDKRIAVGNYFSSREEAEKAVEKLKAFKRLKDKGFRFEGYDSGHNSNKELCGQAYFKAGNFWFDIKTDLDLLFGGEE